MPRTNTESLVSLHTPRMAQDHCAVAVTPAAATHAATASTDVLFFAEHQAFVSHTDTTEARKRRLARTRPAASALYSDECCKLGSAIENAPLYLGASAMISCLSSGAGVRTAPGPERPTTPWRTAWSAPRSWASLASKAPGNKPALVSHIAPAVSISMPSASRSTPTTPRRAWAARQPKTMTELYETAHKCTAAPLLVPRGIVNLGNFCFANAILQMLVYTPAFYMFVTQLSTMVPQDLSNSTPLLEAMIRFLSEFNEEGAAVSDSDAFVPDYVYEAMRLHRRFDVIQIGHQEDAEEFLSLLLNTLHEEVQQVHQRVQARQEVLNRRLGRTHTRHASEGGVPDMSLDGDVQQVERPASPDDDAWLEVGQKGRTSLARSTKSSDSPVTRMFEGRLRSILGVPGSKSSIMLEPYRSLPLDIADHHVTSIEDAMAQIADIEIITDVWAPAHRKHMDATKQVFIEMLPPVLVIHLKRFEFDEVGGVQKSCKPLRYGPVLDVPSEVLSAQLRHTEPSPQYRLYGIVYHHGGLATGGHYTVDVLRQDVSSWLHIDDTQASAIPSDQVFGSVDASEDAYLLFYQKIART